MKKLFLHVICVFCTPLLFAQSNVGIGTSSPDNSSILELQSNRQGFLVPRMSSVERSAISAPAIGLMVYDTDSSCFFYNKSGTWTNLCNATTGATGNFWKLSGNTGTNAAANFVGTQDNNDLVFRTNNNETMRITASGAVGINQPAPNNSAILDIRSTNKGVLFPSLTTAQRNAIAAPANGVTIYNTSLNVHQFWNGSCWVNVGQTVCQFTYSLALSHNSDCLLSSNFNSVSDTLSVNLVSGTPSPVILSASGIPAGVLLNFSNSYVTPSQQVVLTFTALPSAPSGTYNITILAASGSTIQTVNYTLTVYSYNVQVTPATATLNEIGIAPNVLTATANLSIGNPGACGASGTTAILSANNMPAGVTATFGTSSLAVPGNTTITFTSSSCAIPGTYTAQIVATVGSLSSVYDYTIIVQPSVVNITASTNNVNLFNLAGTPSCPIDATFNIASGTVIGSSSTGTPALTTGTFATGSNIVINNSGTIAGAGGAGGDDNNHNLTTCPTMNGQTGGNALELLASGIIINNSGTIGGGGGGGGAGAELGGGNPCFTFYSGTGGGGGAGATPGAGGADGIVDACSPGNPGTLLTGGTAGSNSSCSVSCFLSFGSTYRPGVGGNGGNLGQPGTSGGSANGFVDTGVCGGGSGGAAGCGLKVNGNTYTLNGTAVLGSVCP